MMMIMRPCLVSLALLVSCHSALAGPAPEAVTVPILRASVTVSDAVVRIGDLVDNAGSAARIAVYRAPDLGTTGSLHAAQVIETLRAHQVIGVDTQDLHEISVTRASRTVSAKEIERRIAGTLERRHGLGDAADLVLSFDRELRDIELDPSTSGELHASVARYNTRNGRFDVMFEIANPATRTPTRLRFTGAAVETMEAAVLTRNVERNDVLKASDIVIERRPKADVGSHAANRKQAIGMQVRRALRAGQPLKSSDLAKPDLVARDQGITLIYEAPGLYLTGRGKALEAGSEGDVVNVLNLQSKRVVQGVVVGPGQIEVSTTTPRARIVSRDHARLDAANDASAGARLAANTMPGAKRAGSSEKAQ